MIINIYDDLIKTCEIRFINRIVFAESVVALFVQQNMNHFRIKQL